MRSARAVRACAFILAMNLEKIRTEERRSKSRDRFAYRIRLLKVEAAGAFHARYHVFLISQLCFAARDVCSSPSYAFSVLPQQSRRRIHLAS